jgi:hypothetical protein
MISSHEILGNGALVVVKSREERRGVNGILVNGPKLIALWYDIETDTARCERISFDAARVLAPEKVQVALDLLTEARKRG